MLARHGDNFARHGVMLIKCRFILIKCRFFSIKNASQRWLRGVALIGRLLLAQSEGLDDGTIAGDVVLIEILQHLAAATDELGQRASRSEVLVVLLQVLGEVLDAIGEESNLALS